MGLDNNVNTIADMVFETEDGVIIHADLAASLDSSMNLYTRDATTYWHRENLHAIGSSTLNQQYSMVCMSRGNIEGFAIISETEDLIECRSLTEFAVNILKLGGENIKDVGIRCRHGVSNYDVCEPSLQEVLEATGDYITEVVEPNDELLSFLHRLVDGGMS